MSSKSDRYTDFVFTNFVILLIVWLALFYVLMTKTAPASFTYGTKQVAREIGR